MARQQTRRSTRTRVRSTKPVDSSTQPHSAVQLPNEVIERCLRTGENARLLEEHFGEAQYQELRELSLEAETRAVRGGPKVIILPGIMGSKLGKDNAFLWFDDVYWLDFIDIAWGKLAKLALPAVAKKIDVLGVFLLYYLKLKLRLRAAGYDADYYAFDWRESIHELGKDLAKRIIEDKTDVHLVCHSMGGLVARAAMHNSTAVRKHIGRVIMLGTPNFGSFTPVQALRATHPLVRKIAWLDRDHSPVDLSNKTFGTFPGLYEMLPSPQKHESATFNMFKASSWPREGPRPRQELLDAARTIGDRLAPADERFTLIAGVDQETIVDARLAGEDAAEFEYTLSRDGDGTVPVAFAQLQGAPTYFIEEAHGSLPNNRTVAKAVADILASGKTDRLPTSWSPTRRDRARTVTESQLRVDPFQARSATDLRGPELRNIMDGFLSTHTRDGGEGVLLPVAQAPTAVAPLPTERVVVGRRRQRRLELRIARGSITEADARAYVLGVFEGVTPSGAARAVDARMGGAISDFAARRMFSGRLGEIFVLPVGRNYLRADFIVLAGMGTFDTYNDQIQSIVSDRVLRALIRTDVEDFALVLPGGNVGGNLEASVRCMADGFVSALLDADTDQRFRRITLCEIDPDRHRAIREAVLSLATTKTFDEVELTIDEVPLPPEPLEFRGAIRSVLHRGEDPCYLLVRQEKGSLIHRCALLGAGAKATVLPGSIEIDSEALNAQLAKLRPSSFDHDALADFGAKLAALVLPQEMAHGILGHRDRHLVIVHDAPTSRIPWETLCFKEKGTNWFPAENAGVSRRYIAEGLSVAKWLEQRQDDTFIDVLLIVDPTADLAGARKEGKRIEKLLKETPGVRVDQLYQGEATKQNLLSRLRSGKYDIVHYAGHAGFDPQDPSQSGILCHGHEVLRGRELTGLKNLPFVIFFNACESARIRLDRQSRKPEPVKARDLVEQAAGLAEAFLRGGIANYIGTYWPVSDDAAEAFAPAFYTKLLEGAPLGEAMNVGRKAARDSGSIDWSDYIHYGHHEFVIKQPQNRP